MNDAKRQTTVPQSEGDINLTPARTSWQNAQLDEETRAMLAEDARYFLHQSLSSPCLNALSGCEGSFLIDLRGRRYLDFHGNNVHQVGFGHPKVKQAISDALDELPFCTRRYTNKYAVGLAKKLAALSPGTLNKCLFAPGGAEAISMAIKLARMATGRFKTVSMGTPSMVQLWTPFLSVARRFSAIRLGRCCRARSMSHPRSLCSVPSAAGRSAACNVRTTSSMSCARKEISLQSSRRRCAARGPFPPGLLASITFHLQPLRSPVNSR